MYIYIYIYLTKTSQVTAKLGWNAKPEKNPARIYASNLLIPNPKS